MNDIQLRKNILDELEFEPSIDAADIGVTADNGIVTLSGHVRTYAEKEAAEKVVRRVRGVRGIAACVPTKVARTDDYEVLATEERQRLQKATGISAHRMSPPEQCTSDLCQTAAEHLLEHLGWDRRSVGVLRGETSRQKVISIDGLSRAELDAKIATLQPTARRV